VSFDDWATHVQLAFLEMPAATSRATDPADVCLTVLEFLDAIRGRLLLSPTLELDLLLSTYLDALVALYEECPDERERARTLHDAANRHGQRFERAVNRVLRKPRR
jgi:hypothetical protein